MFRHILREEVLNIYKYLEIKQKGMKASEKATEFSTWINQHRKGYKSPYNTVIGNAIYQAYN